MMKTIEVVAAVIRKDDLFFCCQRGPGRSLEGFWEFPGGKVKTNETPQNALIREINEELLSDISVEDYIITVDYDYPDFHITMHAYFCKLNSGNLELTEHIDKKWITKSQIISEEFAPADRPILEKIKEIM